MGAPSRDGLAGAAAPEPHAGLGPTDGIPSAFTPGPWSADKSKGSAAYTIFDDRNGSLATVWDATWMGRKYNPEANAHLIAAAPELYEVCGDALEVLNAPVITPAALNAVGRKLETALAKARGEA